MNNSFVDFHSQTLEDWKTAFEKSLKGEAVEQYLSTEIIEGINLPPFINKNNAQSNKLLNDIPPAEFPYSRGRKYSSNNWNDVAHYNVIDPMVTNKELLKDLENGFASLEVKAFEIDAGQKFLSLLLNKINPEYLRINFNVKSLQTFSKSLREYYDLKEYDHAQIKGILFNDLFEKTMTKGGWQVSQQQDTKYFFDVLKTNFHVFPHYKSILLKTDLLHNSGLNIIHQIAFTLSKAAHLLQIANDFDLDKAIISKKTALSFSVGTDFLPEIAKIKALKYLWVKLLEAHKVPKTDIQLPYFRANTSLRFLAKKDIYNNIVRGSLQAMSASLAGVDEIYVNPFDKNTKGNSNLGKRISLNTNRILAEESYLNKVVDPLAGSYFLDTLTKELIEKAWDKFCEIEEKGGIIKMMESGELAKIIDADNEKEKAEFKNKTLKMIGVNIHLNSDDKEISEEKPMLPKSNFPPIHPSIIN
jgi:methylmalonyl-CoA mutase